MGVKYRALPLFIALLGFQSGCGLLDPCEGLELPADQSAKVSIAQGIWGHTWFWEGGTQPQASGCGSHPTVTAVSRLVVVYPEISIPDFLALDAATPGSRYVPRAEFEEVLGVEPLATVRSDPLGFFQVDLSPGTYALLIADGNDLAAIDPTLQVFVQTDSVTFAAMDIQKR